MMSEMIFIIQAISGSSSELASMIDFMKTLSSIASTPKYRTAVSPRHSPAARTACHVAPPAASAVARPALKLLRVKDVAPSTICKAKNRRSCFWKP